MRFAIRLLALGIPLLAALHAGAVPMQLTSSYLDGTTLVVQYDDPDGMGSCAGCTITGGAIVPGLVPLGNSLGGFLMDNDPDAFSIVLSDILANDVVSTLDVVEVLDVGGDFFEFELALANANAPPADALVDELMLTDAGVSGTNRALAQETSFLFEGFAGQGGIGITTVTRLDGTSPIPEPGGAAVFCVGLAILRTVRSRQRGR